jgi:hypothetical protein
VFFGRPPSSFVAYNETSQKASAHPSSSLWDRGHPLFPSLPSLKFSCSCRCSISLLFQCTTDVTEARSRTRSRKRSRCIGGSSSFIGVVGQVLSILASRSPACFAMRVSRGDTAGEGRKSGGARRSAPTPLRADAAPRRCRSAPTPPLLALRPVIKKSSRTRRHVMGECVNAKGRRKRPRRRSARTLRSKYNNSIQAFIYT